MTPEEALQVAGLVAELWPKPELSGRRLAFYATALTDIPDLDRAVRAVNQLFVNERWQPVPGAIIDVALDVDSESQRQWQLVLAAASDVQGRRQVGAMPSPVALAVVRRLCGSLADVPVEHGYRLDKVRADFLSAFVKDARTAAIAAGTEERLSIERGD